MDVLEDKKDSEYGIDCIYKLMEACDGHFPTPERPLDQPFLMPIEDIFTISGRGTVVTGAVERGVIKTGDAVEVVGLKDTQKAVVTGLFFLFSLFSFLFSLFSFLFSLFSFLFSLFFPQILMTLHSH